MMNEQEEAFLYSPPHNGTEPKQSYSEWRAMMDEIQRQIKIEMDKSFEQRIAKYLRDHPQ